MMAGMSDFKKGQWKKKRKKDPEQLLVFAFAVMINVKHLLINVSLMLICWEGLVLQVSHFIILAATQISHFPGSKERVYNSSTII